jgi:MarR family transcriptional regulator, 2-MHQ and catechol-resistance regulon repressor
MAREQEAGTHVWLVLTKAARALSAYDRRSVEATGVAYPDFAVLECLLHKGPLPVNRIGEIVSLTSGTMTAAVDRLERKALVERRSDAGDRRARVVHLTPAGRRLIQSAFEAHRTCMEAAVSALTVSERRSLVNLLKKVGLHAEFLLDGNTSPARGGRT